MGRTVGQRLEPLLGADKRSSLGLLLVSGIKNRVGGSKETELAWKLVLPLISYVLSELSVLPWELLWDEYNTVMHYVYKKLWPKSWEHAMQVLASLIYSTKRKRPWSCRHCAEYWIYQLFLWNSISGFRLELPHKQQNREVLTNLQSWARHLCTCSVDDIPRLWVQHWPSFFSLYKETTLHKQRVPSSACHVRRCLDNLNQLFTSPGSMEPRAGAADPLMTQSKDRRSGEWREGRPLTTHI